MSEKYPLRFSLGHVLFLVVSISLAGVFIFYLGARFGPELFWGIKFDPNSYEPLLPDGVTDKELLALLKEESSQVTFYEELEKESVPFEMVFKDEKKEKNKEPKKKEVPKKVEAPIKMVSAIESVKKEKVPVIKKEPPKEVKKDKEPSILSLLQKETEKVKKEVKKEPVLSDVYTLQVGSFSEIEEAKKVQQRFKKKGYSAFLKVVEIPNKGKWYRVQVGRYPSEARALKGKDSISQQFQIVPLVVKLSR